VNLAVSFAFLLGLSFFLGLAFEGIFARQRVVRPGGIRTFPMLAIIGGILYLFDPARLIAFTAGLLIVGAWLMAYYRAQCVERDGTGEADVGLMVPLLNVYAYVLGALVMMLPYWLAVGTTVIATLLLAGRKRLHDLAQSIEIREIVVAAQFLILAGLVLPLLPAEPVTSLTNITPRAAGFSLVAVCGLSYASYLIQRYVARAAGGLWMAALGGMYSSTATTVVLARLMKTQTATLRQAQAGITLATGIMYLRILAVIAVFNFALARTLVPFLVALSLVAMLIAVAQYCARERSAAPVIPPHADRNPLELGPALVFTMAFVVISLLTNWVKAQFGSAGILTLAGLVGFSDIDPFVLSLAQGGAGGLSGNTVAAAVLIAASSNNVLKAAYTVVFAGWRASVPCVISLCALALAGIGVAMTLVAR
jgi:uncharacterized membrane protein (DUF4010 family)